MEEEKVKDYYQKDRVVSKYEKKRFLSSGGKFIDQNEKEIVSSLLKEENAKKVLDVGAGTGRFSILLAKEGYDVTGLDQSQEMLNTIDQKSREQNLNISLIKGDAFKLPFEDNTFDACTSIRVLWHFENPEDLIKEMVRVTKKDGVIIFDLLNKKSVRYLYTPIANLFVYTKLMTKKNMREMINTAEIAKEKEFFILPYFFYRYSPKFLVKMLGGIEKGLQKTKCKNCSSVIYFKIRK
jgi:ubiquinone/menaquinone biosynthesis C-methylase UbiE